MGVINCMKLKIYTMFPWIPLPEYGSPGAAGFDIRIYNPDYDTTRLVHGQFKLFHTHLKVAVPTGMMLCIRQRSGLSLKYPNYIVNSPGVIDSDYRGEIMIGIRNNTVGYMDIVSGDRWAQGVITPIIKPHIEEVFTADELGATTRGSGGFGSTGN